VTVTGSALPVYDYKAKADPGIGKTAPTLAGQDFSGTPVTTAPDGHPKVISFVAHWCPHCQREVPRLASYLRDHGLPAGVEFYFVPTATNPNYGNYPPSSWLQEAGVSNVPTIVDSDKSDALVAYGQGDFPYMVMLDSQNKVVFRHSGETAGTDTYAAWFDALAKGQPIPAEANGAASTPTS
jgi:thiol-disulfide isomerase/thioredoxin